MKLTEQDRALLAGEAGYSARKSMEILVALGKIYDAERFLDVTSVQVSGVSYHNLGEAGLEWLEAMAEDGRAVTVATLNPAGMDLEHWQEQGIDESFARAQLRVVDAYRRMGIAPSCTCTPYLVGNLPAPREHVAWSESSAVTFANSVLGARTNREGGPSALASALTGRTPAYGLHLEENRVPTLEVVLETGPRGRDTSWWGALGSALGRLGEGRVLFLRRPPRPNLAELKSLCASIVTFGGSPLFHLEGVTPEAMSFPIPGESISVTAGDLEDARERLNDAEEEIDLVCLGCPHASLAEIASIAELLKGRTVSTQTWICTARSTAAQAADLGLIETIEATGALVVCDTCFVVAPLADRFKTVATDSAKGCFYARGHNRLAVRHGSVEECLQAAVTGRWT